jgi:hypothetical protein
MAWGLAAVLLFTPLLALPVLALPLAPAQLPLGLAVFCSVPTALSSGITFTQVGGGPSFSSHKTRVSNPQRLTDEHAALASWDQTSLWVDAVPHSCRVVAGANAPQTRFTHCEAQGETP